MFSKPVDYRLRKYPSEVRDVPGCRRCCLFTVPQMGDTDIPILLLDAVAYSGEMSLKFHKRCCCMGKPA